MKVGTELAVIICLLVIALIIANVTIHNLKETIHYQKKQIEITKDLSFFVLKFDDNETEWSFPITPGTTWKMHHTDPVVKTIVIIPELGSEWEECEEGCE